MQQPKVKQRSYGRAYTHTPQDSLVCYHLSPQPSSRTKLQAVARGVYRVALEAPTNEYIFFKTTDLTCLQEVWKKSEMFYENQNIQTPDTLSLIGPPG